MSAFHDTNQRAEQERRELRARRAAAAPLPRVSSASWCRILVGVAILLVTATILIRGALWMAQGCPDNRPSAERGQ